ncbi:hypothetical protein [Clostridium grantii]|uniref:Uncharacterized protein n=1 Tax=Clostridium grantii DSM 8605 TaxID=1121316 RepID=A0A1M5UNA6_9CLOT|nr:hypothetical protein [Clostridium grantii]SHH64437.1 hypothetical protein SAMN02745207_01840 [Clostridium grantii DSM 8605]
MLKKLVVVNKLFVVNKYNDPKKIYRYDSKSKSFNIDISLDYYRDIHNEWDYSPDKFKDLDEELLKYLEECSLEIPLKNKVIINFFLPQKIKDVEREEKIIIGFKNHISYKIRNKLSVKRNMIRSTLLYGVWGVVLLFVAYLLQKFIHHSFLGDLIPEGFLIGGWVLLWEIFSIVFFQIGEVNKKIKIYKRLLNSDVKYNYI